MNSYLTIFLVGLLISSAIIDLYKQKIPNIITFPGILMALFFHFSTNGLDGLIFSGTGIITGIGILLIPYLFGGLGAGDAKMMGVVGGVLGAKGVFVAFLLTALVGGIYALFIIFFNRDQFKGFFKKQYDTLLTLILTRKFIPDPVENSSGKPRLCYGLAIAIGTGIYLIIDYSDYNLLI